MFYLTVFNNYCVGWLFFPCHVVCPRVKVLPSGDLSSLKALNSRAGLHIFLLYPNLTSGSTFTRDSDSLPCLPPQVQMPTFLIPDSFKPKWHSSDSRIVSLQGQGSAVSNYHQTVSPASPCWDFRLLIWIRSKIEHGIIRTFASWHGLESE